MGRAPDTANNTGNAVLRGLLAEAGWSGSALAVQVNAVAADSGRVLRADRRWVSNWLAGRRPYPPIPGLVAEALSRRLGRVVTVAETGLAPRPRRAAGLGVAVSQAHPGLERQSSPHASPQDCEQEPSQARDLMQVVAVLTQLAAFDGDRRRMPSDDVYSLAALAVPTWASAAHAHRSAIGTGIDATVESGSGMQVAAGQVAAVQVEAGQVAAAEHMAVLFADTDTAFGGGYARGALAAYLAYDIAPRLRAAAQPALRARLLRAATQLSYRCAFMCFDDQAHGLTQRYYRAALDLAAENNDPIAYAVTLRAMSVQARSLGHHREAIQLAETAAATSRRIPPLRQAFVLGQVAVASAADGDRASALSALHLAEHRLSQATSQTSTRTRPPISPHAGRSSRGAGDDGCDSAVMGGYHTAALAHQQAATFALIGDHKAAIAALTASNHRRPLVERRSRAIVSARLAELHLDHGELERAVAIWHTFLDDYPYLTCGRATTALKVLRSRLHPHSTQPAARALLIRARIL